MNCMQESEGGRFSCIPMSVVAAGKRGAWVWILGPQRLSRDPLQQGGVGAGVSLNWGDTLMDWESHVVWGVMDVRKLDPHPILGSFDRI